MTVIEFLLYGELFLCSTLYVVYMDYRRKKQGLDDTWPSPDGAWLQVIIGVGMCLLFATLDVVLQPYRDVIQLIAVFWLAFFVGGTPVVFWQTHRIYTCYKSAIAYQREQIDGQTTEAMATEEEILS